MFYTALTATVLLTLLSHRKPEESEFSDCKSLELENARLKNLEVVDVTINEWLVSLMLVSGLFYLHRWIRLKRIQTLFDNIKGAEYLQNTKQFKDVCSNALKSIDECLKIHEGLLLQSLKIDIGETETAESSTDEDKTVIVEDLCLTLRSVSN